jgi:putative spermidine/putrescine transport system substrate-binding protein
MLIISTVIFSVFPGGKAEENKEIDLLKLDYEKIKMIAEGQSVNFYMWGGSDTINSWIDNFAADSIKESYGISLKRVPMDASVFVNKLLAEKQAGRKEGVIDLLWINAENFKNAKEAELLYGPFLDKLPNYKNFVDPVLAESDAGYPIEGFEAPYGRAQFNFEYDTAIISNPPDSYKKLTEWVKKNPNRFTYPQPPDFTGSAFLRQTFIALTGGAEQYKKGFDQTLFDKNAPVLWKYLNSIKPYLWQEGESYPKDLAALDTLFERGEVDLNMSFTQARASTRIAEGRYRKTVRTFLMNKASLYNTHFVAIPFNAPSKEAAMVLANFLMSPEAQYSKNVPDNWGDFTVLTVDKLDDKDKSLFNSLDLGDAALPFEEWDNNGIPEIPSAYIEAIEKGWEEHVLKN